MCLHFEALDKKVSYPCKDHPAACGWGRKDAVESDSGTVYSFDTCVYPYCWWGGHFLEGYISKNDMILEKGQKFSAILYDGQSIDAAQTVVSYLNTARTKDRPVPLNGSDLKIRVITIAISEHEDMDGTRYKILLEGELV